MFGRILDIAVFHVIPQQKVNIASGHKLCYEQFQGTCLKFVEDIV